MSEQDNNLSVQDTGVQNTADVVAEGVDDIASQLSFGDDETESHVEKADANADASEETKGDATEADGSTESTEESQQQDTKTQEVETEAERNRRFYEQRQTAKRQAEQAIDQTYQPQKEDELTRDFLDQGYDEFQAKMLAREEIRSQKEQISEARAEIAELNMQLNTESLQVLHDFPEFDDKSDKYDAEFTQKATELYRQAAQPVMDPRTGLIVKTNLTPYAFYKELHDMRERSTTTVQMKAQRAAEAQMAAVAPPASNPPIKTIAPEDKQASDLEAALDAVR